MKLERKSPVKSAPVSSRQNYALIELLRGFAAISVLVYHVIEFNGWDSFPSGYGLFWFKWGWAAVDIFYIISGFVITLSALKLRDDPNLSEKQIFCQFMDRRIRRIVPLHYLSLLIFIFIFSELVTHPDFDANFIAHLFFVHNFVPEFHRSINAPNWTLAVEMQFYLVLILVIRFVNWQNLKNFVIGAFFIAFAWRAFSFYFSQSLRPGNGEYTFIFATQLPGMIDFFACGMLLAFFARSHYFARLGKRLAFRFALFACFAIWGAISYYVFTAVSGDFWNTAGAVIFPRSMLAILFTLLVALACAFDIGPATRKILAPLLYLGTISYGIYLFHFPALLLVKDAQIPNILKLGIVLGAAIGAAALSWHFFEKRFLKTTPRNN